MKKLHIISANLGGFDEDVPWVEQVVPGWEVEVFRFDDTSFPPRRLAMTPRLQSRIPKMFGWEMAPGADAYLWIDASFALLHEEAAGWFVSHLGSSDFACFRHPDRHSIKEEYEFLRDNSHHKYLRSRYEGELLEEQYRVISSDPTFIDHRLFNGGAFVYTPDPWIIRALTDWWVHTSRYHCIDQLSLPYVLFRHIINVVSLPGSIYSYPLVHTRNREWRRAHSRPDNGDADPGP